MTDSGFGSTVIGVPLGQNSVERPGPPGVTANEVIVDDANGKSDHRTETSSPGRLEEVEMGERRPFRTSRDISVRSSSPPATRSVWVPPSDMSMAARSVFRRSTMESGPVRPSLVIAHRLGEVSEGGGEGSINRLVEVRVRGVEKDAGQGADREGPAPQSPVHLGQVVVTENGAGAAKDLGGLVRRKEQVVLGDGGG